MAKKISELSAASTLDGTETAPIVQTTTKKVTLAKIWQEVLHAFTGKTTPVDADEIGIADSAASWVGKKVTLTNFKAFLKTYFDPLYGGRAGVKFTSDTSSQTASDPGSGVMRWNNATLSSATAMYFDDNTADGTNLDTLYATLGTTGLIYMRQEDDETRWQIVKYTAVTDSTGYWTFTVTQQASGASAIQNSKSVLVLFAPAGGSSSGGTKTYAIHTPMTSQPPASNFATLDTRNSIAVLDFDASTDESIFWVSVMPESASLGSGLKIRIHWMATSATSGAVIWEASLERMTTDLDSDSFDTVAFASGTANGTSGVMTVTEITLTNIDSVTAGDAYRLKISRDANGTNGTDDMSGDAELVCVEVRSAA